MSEAAVVGTGYMGAIHTAVIKKIEGLTIAGVFDQDIAKARALSRKIGCKVFKNIGDVIKRKPLFVSICTPTETHVPIALKFVRNGLNVFIEKPIAESVRSARKLAEQARRTGSLIGVGHLERYNPAFVALRSRLSNAPSHVIGGEFRRMNPKPERERNTGVVSELSIHDFDLALALWGRPKDVKSYVVRGSDSRVELSSLSILNYASFQITVRSSWLSKYRERTLSVLTNSTRLVADLLNFRLHESGLDRNRTANFAPNNLVLAELSDFAAAVKAGRVPQISAREGIEALRLAEASRSASEMCLGFNS